jgi:hypothetical protein
MRNLRVQFAATGKQNQAAKLLGVQAPACHDR